MENIYKFDGSNAVITPALIYYRDIIRTNIAKAISLAGGAEHLWPHVKTHKMDQMIRLQMEAGIHRFKCATIAEAEMSARSGASDVLIAYPLVGPNIRRCLNLVTAFPSVHFWAIGDDIAQISKLGDIFTQAGKQIDVLLDLNLGMDRTGVTPDKAESFFIKCDSIPGISLRGLHCYDGHRTEHSFEDRKKQTDLSAEIIRNICRRLNTANYHCDTLVLGGSPSMPCYSDFSESDICSYLSPGTFFVNDYGYSKKYPDLSFTPGAAILTRVISCPIKGHFTLDLGYKGVASDPEGTRGIIVNIEHAHSLFQSEEHWAFAMDSGYEELCPKVGDELFVIPTHICPTSALYPSVPVVENGKICAYWDVTARNRQIIY